MRHREKKGHGEIIVEKAMVKKKTKKKSLKDNRASTAKQVI
jgi:hypothetical protein